MLTNLLKQTFEISEKKKSRKSIDCTFFALQSLQYNVKQMDYRLKYHILFSN